MLIQGYIFIIKINYNKTKKIKGTNFRIYSFTLIFYDLDSLKCKNNSRTGS